MQSKTFRQLMRWVHIGAASVLGVYIYSPLGEVELAQTLVRFVVFPLIGLAGIALWQQKSVLRLIGRE